MWQAVLIAFICIFSFLCIKDLRIGIFFIAGFLPSYLIRLNILSLPTTILEVMVLVLFIVFLWEVKKQRLKVRYNNSFLYLAVIWAVIGLVGVINSPQVYSSLGLWRAYYLEPLFFFIVFISAINPAKHLKPLLMVLGFESIYLSIIGFIQYYSGWIPSPWNIGSDIRMTSLFDYPNAFALFIVPILCLFISLSWFQVNIINQKKSDIFFKSLVIIFLLIGLVLSKSAGGIFGLIGCVLFILIVSLFNSQYKKKAILSISAFIFIIILIFSFSGIRNRLTQELTMQNNSGQIRIAMWTGALRMIKDHPIKGMGSLGFPFYYEDYKLARHTETLLYPHNLFLNFWLEIGIIGLMFFCYLIYWFYRKGVVLLNDSVISIVIMAGMAGLLLHGLVDVPYFKNDLAILFWILIGIMAVWGGDNFSKKKCKKN